MDKKSQHVGNHGGAYTDMDGMSRQFTYIDHDKKTSVGTSNLSDKERKALAKQVRQSIDETIEEILSLPPNISNNWGLYTEFLVRNVEENRIEWHEEMVRNACRVNDELRHNLHLTVWRNTVKPQYWFEQDHKLTHEDIMAGKWKELT